jgi:hypothetical protein
MFDRGEQSALAVTGLSFERGTSLGLDELSIEYGVASVGLEELSICDLSLRVSGYTVACCCQMLHISAATMSAQLISEKGPNGTGVERLLYISIYT